METLIKQLLPAIRLAIVRLPPILLQTCRHDMALMVNGRQVDVQCGKPDKGCASDVRRCSMMHNLR